MRICFITEYFPTGNKCDIKGGSEAVAFYEAKYLARNHDIDVITSFERGTKREDQFENIHVFRCGRARDYVHKNAFTSRFLFIRSVYFYSIKRNYDLVVGFSILTYPVAWKVSKKLKVPCIIRYHDVLIGKWFRNFGLTGFIGELLERYTLSRKYYAIIAVSNYTAINLKRFFREKDKVHVVHNGVEIPEKSFEKSQIPTITCVSRLVKYKHVDDLLKALVILLKDFPLLQCRIIGTGPENRNLRKLSSKLQIASNVTFSGFIPDHEEILNMIGSSHVLCLPSSLEGFGIVIMESMACGVPFVAADIPAIREASDSRGGLFYKCRDVEDLANKLRMILEQNQLQNRLGEEGLERARDFQWIEISKNVEAIYEKAVFLNQLKRYD